MGEFIHTTREGHVLIVTLSRPEILNSLHGPACLELEQILTEYEADPDLWVAIIHGEGRAFCAGHDMNMDVKDPLPASGWAGMSERGDLTKPIIAAVHGYAAGGGFEIVLCCDLVIADETAKFALSEPRVGAVAFGGGVARLIKRIPTAVAMGMILTGRTMNAAEADRHGLLTERVPAGEALSAARRWAEQILLCAPLCVSTSKRIALEVLEGPDFLAQMAHERIKTPMRLFATDDSKEGFDAFLQKRKPVWKGR